MSEDPTEALLKVARDIIAKRGYVGLTMRTASAAAGVTPDVARRYYRNRETLLAAALRLPDDPVSAIPALLAPGVEGMGEHLVRFTLDTLRDPEARDDLLSMARAGASAGQAVSGLQEFIEVGVVDRVAGTIRVPDARMRASLISSYLMGVAIMRYGVRLEPLASASDEEVIRMVSPVIQDLLDPRRPIPGSARDRAQAASHSAKEEQARISQPKFDPDPAATRAAKQRAAAEAADRAIAQAKRAEARAKVKSKAKSGAGSLARPAASLADQHSGETSAKPTTGAAPSSRSTAKPTTGSERKAAPGSDASQAVQGRTQRHGAVPAEAANVPRVGPEGADAAAAEPTTPPTRARSSRPVAAKSARTSTKAPTRSTTKRAQAPGGKPRQSGESGAPKKVVRPSPAKDPGSTRPGGPTSARPASAGPASEAASPATQHQPEESQGAPEPKG